MVLGPTAPQTGLSGVLLVLIWGLIRNERKERQKRREQRLSDDLAGIDAFWRTNPRGAVNLFVVLSNQVRSEKIEVLEARLERLWESDWHERVLDQAFEAFVNMDDERAELLARFVKDYADRVAGSDLPKMGAGSEPIKPREPRYLLDLLSSSEKGRPIGEPALQLEAIVALASRRGPVLADRLVPALVKLLFRDNSTPMKTVRFLHKKKDDDQLPRWLQRKLSGPLDELGRQPGLGEDRALVSSLRTEKPYNWLTFPFRSDESLKSSEDDDIQKALKRLDWKNNPFGPDRVEDDFGIRFKAYVVPPLWENLNDDQSFVFSAQSGSGQTSALWKAKQFWQGSTSRRLLPVFADTRSLLASTTQAACYDSVSRDILRTLLEFFKENPTYLLPPPTLNNARFRV